MNLFTEIHSSMKTISKIIYILQKIFKKNPYVSSKYNSNYTLNFQKYQNKNLVNLIYAIIVFTYCSIDVFHIINL